MSHVSGKLGAVYFTSVGATCTVAQITGIKSWSLDYASEALETTDFGDSGHRNYIPGLDGWSGSFEGFKDGAPVSLGSKPMLELRETTVTGQLWKGTALITGMHPTVDVDGIVSISYDFVGDGTVTVPTA